MVANTELAKIMGVSPSKVLLCEDGDVVEITDKNLDFDGRIPAEFVVPVNLQRGKKSKKAKAK
jgi:mRNA degradation ribonuclease J1/J2